MILWAVLGGLGESGFRYGRYCGLQTCRPVENDLLLLMRRTNVSWDVGDNSCLVDPCDLGRAKAKLLFRNLPCNSTVNELRSGESIRFKTHVLFLFWTDPDLVFTAQSSLTPCCKRKFTHSPIPLLIHTRYTYNVLRADYATKNRSQL